jgi:hypothetical protein
MPAGASPQPSKQIAEKEWCQGWRLAHDSTVIDGFPAGSGDVSLGRYNNPSPASSLKISASRTYPAACPCFCGATDRPS